MKIGRRKRCGKCRSCGKTKKRFSHSSLDLRSTLPTTPAAAVLPQTQLSFYSPQVAMISCYFEQGFRTDAEQEVIEDLLVLQRQRGELVRQSEYNMDIGNRQK